MAMIYVLMYSPYFRDNKSQTWDNWRSYHTQFYVTSIQTGNNSFYFPLPLDYSSTGYYPWKRWTTQFGDTALLQRSQSQRFKKEEEKSSKLWRLD